MGAMIFFIVCAIAAIFCFAFSIYKSVTFVKNPVKKLGFTEHFKRIIPLVLGFTVAFTAMLIWIYPWAKITPKVEEIIQAILGGILFSSSIATAINAFIIHYYANSFEEKRVPPVLDKLLYIFTVAGFTVSAIFLFVTLNGFADYLSYPLANSISFTQGFSKPGEGGRGIAFYALCILAGALLVYFLCDHKLYKEYGKHGLLESTFLVAFPAGIIGARIFYVVGNFNLPVGEGGFGGEFSWKIFAIWEGGLTILGGAICGIIAGVLWLKSRKQKINVALVADIVVPSILIAQAVGRWGNFFNCEVHGLEANEALFTWLPRVVFNNAHYSTAGGSVAKASDGTLFVPLFFIEGLINLFGFGLIAHVFGKKFRKYTEFGDLVFAYVIWYGLTRVILEPLRDPSYNMGKNGYWSWVWSMLFVAGGALLIVCNHILQYFIKKKAGKTLIISSTKVNSMKAMIGLAIGGIALIIPGIIMMATGEFKLSISYSVFNWGCILLVLGVSTLILMIIAVFYFIKATGAKKETNE